MKHLDQLDALVLKELLQDGRKNFTSIAKANNISTAKVSKHFSEMEQAGIIVGSTIQFNYSLFGYQGITSILIRSEPQHAEQVFDYLEKNHSLASRISYGSNHTVMTVTMLKSIKELANVSEMINKCRHVDGANALLWTNVRNFPENLTMKFLPENSIRHRFKKSTSGTIQPTFDDLDLRIVNKLRENGSTTFSQIAQAVVSSTDTVKRRYNRLVSNNFIKVSLQINPELIGYKAGVHFLISLSRTNDLLEAVNTISNIPDISYLVKFSGGDYDLLVCAFIRDIYDFFFFN